MEIEELICTIRLGCEDVPEEEQPEARNEFQRDFDRIIFFPAFRRLQGKTQVFPFPANDSTHNRLTHSLETYSIARSLGTITANLIGYSDSDIIGDITGAAGLAHDIGNSPFGHVGEFAFSNYFNEKEGKQFIASFSEQEKADLQKYEGNAIGFRILTNSKPYIKSNSGGIGLTYSTLASYIKYPTRSNLTGKNSNVSEKKHSFFSAEESTVKTIFNKFNIPAKSNGKWPRFPLSFLIEAADDISYLIIDFEDGYRNRIIEHKNIYELFEAIIKEYDASIMKKIDLITDPANKIGFLRSKAINSLIYQVADVFLNNKSDIFEFKYEKALIDSIASKRITDQIKSISENELYNAKSVAEIEVAGFEIINGLLNNFITSLLTSPNGPLGKKVKRLIPVEYYYKSKDEDYKNYELILNISEYICGMTDSYAIDLYRKLKGIEIPNY